MRARDERTATEKRSGADVLSSRRKFRKTLAGFWHPLYVQGLKQTPLNRSQTVTAPYKRLIDGLMKKKNQLQENDWTTDHLINNKRLFSCDNRRIEKPMSLRVS